MAAGSPASLAPDAAVRSGGPARLSPAATTANIPLAFIALGLASFAVALAWLAVEPGLLLLPYSHPRVLALVHLWLPGFLLSVCFGACYQMMPVVLGVPLVAGRKRLWSRVVLHAVGTVMLALGFASGRYEWVAIGGTVVAHGAIAFGSTALRTFAESTRRDAVAWSFALSACWLMLTVTLGAILAIDRRWSLLGLPGFSLLRAHAHLGLAGFFLSLLQGVTFQLLPMFTMGQAKRPRFILAGLIATQVGLPFLATGLGLEWRVLAIAGAGIIAAGVGASGIGFVATLKSRRRARLELPIRSFVIGAALAAAAVVFGIVMLASPGAAQPQLPSAYGFVLIAGALSLMILGMLGKIVPFLVWMKAYGPKVGRGPVPVATSLSSKPLERAWLSFHIAGLVLLSVAIALASSRLALAGSWVLAAGGAALLSNMTMIARHLTRSRPTEIGMGDTANERI